MPALRLLHAGESGREHCSALPHNEFDEPSIVLRCCGPHAGSMKIGSPDSLATSIALAGCGGSPAEALRRRQEPRRGQLRIMNSTLKSSTSSVTAELTFIDEVEGTPTDYFDVEPPPGVARRFPTRRVAVTIQDARRASEPSLL